MILLGVWSNFCKKNPRKLYVCSFSFEKSKLWSHVTIFDFCTKIGSKSKEHSTFKFLSLTQRTYYWSRRWLWKSLGAKSNRFINHLTLSCFFLSIPQGNLKSILLPKNQCMFVAWIMNGTQWGEIFFKTVLLHACTCIFKWNVKAK